MSGNVTSMIKMLRTEDVWQPRLGAPRGNRNRFKTGLYTNEAKALRKQIAAWKLSTRMLLKQIEQEFPSSSQRREGYEGSRQ